MGADQDYKLAAAVGLAELNLPRADPAGTCYPGDAAGNLEDASFDDNRKLETLHSAARDPQIGIGGVDDLGRRAHEARQDTPLKDHQEHGTSDPQYSYREPGAIMCDVIPSQPHTLIWTGPL